MNWDEIRISFIYAANEFKGDWIKALEVGNAMGNNAVRMLRAYDNMHLTCVDVNIQPAFLNALMEFRHRTKTIEMPSVEAAKLYPDEYFDYIYIDACHDYWPVKKDLEAWWPKLKPGGVFSGHDLEDSGVDKAVREFFKGSQYRVYGIHTLWPEGGINSDKLKEKFGLNGDTSFIYKTDWWTKK